LNHTSVICIQKTDNQLFIYQKTIVPAKQKNIYLGIKTSEISKKMILISYFLFEKVIHIDSNKIMNTAMLLNPSKIRYL
jgi:hypothetical protein